MKFKVGDLITINKRKKHSYISLIANSICEVIDINCGYYDLKVTIIDNDTSDQIGSDWSVKSEYFKLHKSNSSKEVITKQKTTLQDIIATDFIGYTIDEINAIRYIQMMSTELNKNIMNIDFVATFYNEHNKLITSHQEINKILFAFKNEEKKKKEVPDEIIDLLKVNEIDRISKEKKILLERKKCYLDEINRVYLKLSELNMDIIKIVKEISYLRDNHSTRIVEQIKLISEIPNLEFDHLGNDCIHFKLLNNTILTYKNECAGIDLRVDLGQFIICINLIHFTIRLLPFSNNVFLNEFIHPHFYTDGSPCLGTLKESYNEALTEFDIKTMVEIILTLIKHYNPDDPYRTLADFAIKSEQIQPNGEILEEEEEVLNWNHYFQCPECECSWDNIYDNDCNQYEDCPDCGFECVSYDITEE